MADVPGPSPEPAARRFFEIAPLLRAVGIASDAKKLILASAGLFALRAGWLALGRAFGDRTGLDPTLWPGPSAEAFSGPWSEVLPRLAELMTEPFRLVAIPFLKLFSRGVGPWAWSRSALMAAWAVAVWGVFGGAIARIAVVQAAGDRRVGLGSAVRFAIRKAGPLIGAPLTPMLAVAIFAASCAGFGLLYRIPRGIGATVAAFLGFLPLLAGLLMAMILLGLAAGWPLMHATVAAEGEDAADALSRAYSYVNQRLARYAAHALAAWAIGTAGLVLVLVFARVVVALADWGVALGAPEDLGSTELAASGRIFWSQLVGWLVHAWIYSYFWSAASVIYLILRRDVDGAEWHDVYLPEHDADTFADEAPAPEPEPTSKPAEEQ